MKNAASRGGKRCTACKAGKMQRECDINLRINAKRFTLYSYAGYACYAVRFGLNVFQTFAKEAKIRDLSVQHLPAIRLHEWG